MLYVGKVARTYRLDEGLVSRLESRAGELGQSHTVFVSRALEKALSGVPKVGVPAADKSPGGSAGDSQVSPARSPASSRASEVAAVDRVLKDPPGDLPRIARRHWA